jgi:hypothetical protein
LTQTERDDDVELLSGDDEEDEESEADEAFDDRQQNTGPLSKVDALVEACLPESMLTTRARWYLSREAVTAVAETLTANISKSSRKSSALFPVTLTAETS